MLLLIGAFTIGLILSLLAFGVFISFRIFSFPTSPPKDRSRSAARSPAVLIVGGVHPVLATGAAFAAGALAGTTTGVLHTRFQASTGCSSGILVMTALYSINLHVMGKSNLPLLSERTLASMAESAALSVFGARDGVMVRLGREHARRRRRSCSAFVAAATWAPCCISSSAPTSAPRCRPPATTRR